MSEIDEEDADMATSPHNAVTICCWCHSGNIPLQFFMDTETGTQKFCSERCFLASRRAAFKSQKICDWCKKGGDSLQMREHSDNHQLHFCSDHCSERFDSNIIKILHEKKSKEQRSPNSPKHKSVESRLLNVSGPQGRTRDSNFNLQRRVCGSLTKNQHLKLSKTTKDIIGTSRLAEPRSEIAEESLENGGVNGEYLSDMGMHLWLQMQSNPIMHAWFLQQAQQRMYPVQPSLPVLPQAPILPQALLTPKPQATASAAPSSSQPTVSTESHFGMDPVTIILPKPVLVPIPIAVPIPIPIFKTAPEILTILREQGWKPDAERAKTTSPKSNAQEPEVRYKLELPNCSENSQAMDLSVKMKRESDSLSPASPQYNNNPSIYQRSMSSYLKRRQKIFDAPSTLKSTSSNSTNSSLLRDPSSRLQSIKDKYKRGSCRNLPGRKAAKIKLMRHFTIDKNIKR